MVESSGNLNIDAYKHTQTHTNTHRHTHIYLIPVEKLFDVKFVFALVSSITASAYTVYKEY